MLLVDVHSFLILLEFFALAKEDVEALGTRKVFTIPELRRNLLVWKVVARIIDGCHFLFVFLHVLQGNQPLRVGIVLMPLLAKFHIVILRLERILRAAPIGIVILAVDVQAAVVFGLDVYAAAVIILAKSPRKLHLLLNIILSVVCLSVIILREIH